MVRKIIGILNEQYAGIQRESSVYGLAQSMLRTTGTVTELMPCIIQPDGEGKYIGLDDVNKLMIYHKLVNASSVQVLNGAGDNPGNLVNTYTLGMIVTWDRKAMDLMADEMLMLVQANTPLFIKGIPDMKLARIRISSANLDTLQVIAQEYRSDNLRIPSNILMMQVNYTIELTFNPACIKTCP